MIYVHVMTCIYHYYTGDELWNGGMVLWCHRWSIATWAEDRLIATVCWGMERERERDVGLEKCYQI